MKAVRAPGEVVVAIGAHPDVEIGVRGTPTAHRGAGDSVAILKLSRDGNHERHQIHRAVRDATLPTTRFVSPVRTAEASIFPIIVQPCHAVTSRGVVRFVRNRAANAQLRSDVDGFAVPVVIREVLFR